MSRNKLKKFDDISSYSNVFELPYGDLSADVQATLFPRSDNPLVLELGCGRGEYTVGLAKRCPQKNFIGVDTKGARMWTGATEAREQKIVNAGFLRTSIQQLPLCFRQDSVSELWLTFSDPQMKSITKRLTSTYFLERYRKILKDNGVIHVKTDSHFLYTYTRAMVEHNALPLLAACADINTPDTGCPLGEEVCQIETYYEQQWRKRGITIKYLAFTLPREGALTEPMIEIPLDDYRSYGRTKRSDLEKSM